MTATKEAVEKLGRKAWIYTADMADQESVKALTPKVLADGHQVRILVTCAGIQRRHPCEEFPDSDFNEVRMAHAGALLYHSAPAVLTTLALVRMTVKREAANSTYRLCKSTSTPSSHSAATLAPTC